MNLDLVAKIVEEFENPPIPEENLSELEDFENSTNADADLLREGEGALDDDALSEANDAVARVLGESRRSRAQRKRFAERERSRMRKAAERLAEKLHLDNIDIVDEGAQFGDKRAKAEEYLASLAEETK